jgi:hypothetical protein
MAVALDLQPIEPAGFHALGRVGVSGDCPLDVPVFHHFGKGAMRGFAHIGWRDHRQPVVLRPARPAAQMGDLDHHCGAVRMDVVGELAEPAHDLVLVEQDVAERLRTVGRDHRGAADHRQPDAALGLFGMIEPIAFLRHALDGISRLVRARHQPVAQHEML